MEDIEQGIKAYILRQFMFDKPESALDNALPLIEEGIIDSLGIFLLIAFIEKRFSVKIDPVEVVLENFATINAIKHLLVSKLHAKPSA